ncbi:MAG: trigger factor [Bdellovibrionales bacterium]|nr:trigger factor [Bdellovibrionales bacterium]
MADNTEYSSSVVDIDEVTKQVEVSIPAQVVNEAIEAELGRIAKTTTLKGFRKGKAPKNMVERLHGSRVRMDIAHRLISNSLPEVIQKHKIDAIGEPEIDISSFEPGQQLDYKANLFLFPTPEVKGYDGVKVESPKHEVTDENVDAALEEIRRSKATVTKIEEGGRDVAQKGDVIDSSLIVEIEGEEAGPAEPLVVAIGEGALPEDLEAGLLGMKVGEEKAIESKIPDDHKDEALRGKVTIYRVTLNGLSERVLPEVDDQFAKDCGFDVETALELKLKIREQLEETSRGEEKADAQARILDALLETNIFAVPQILVDDEIRNLLMKNGLVDPNKVDLRRFSVAPFRQGLNDIATKRVRTAVLVDRIAEQENLTATDEDLEAAYQEMAEKSGMPLEEVKKFFADEHRRMNFSLEQTRNKVLDFLVEKASVKYVDPEKLKAKEEKAAKAREEEAKESDKSQKKSAA